MFDTPFSQAMLGMLIAVAAGAVIGIEREQARAGTGNGFGGVRTYPAICLAGALAGLLAQALGPWIVVAGILVIGVLLAISHYHEVETRQGSGITSEIAAVVTYLLGVLATMPVGELAVHHRLLLVPAIAGGLMSLLSVKEPLHDAVRKLSLDDMYASAKFVLLALIVLPLLPNEGFGP
ncbi:MAG TPA: MgtC/SapB family protein, partial [Myxococcota bacterium]|nr:MgtC/SapB family protein [Myxococcota bacterium]